MSPTHVIRKSVALYCGAALLVVSACGDGRASEPAPARAPDRGNEFPRSVAATDEGKTAIAPARPVPSINEPIAIAPAPTVAAEPALPGSYDELMSAGRRLIDATHFDQAVAHFEKAIEVAPRRALPHVQMARAFLGMTDADRARPYAEIAVQMTPQSSQAWNTLGRVELAEGNIDAAVTSFQRAADENPDNSFAWNNLGYVLLGQERYDEAAAALENATNGDRPTAYMWNNLGMAYEHLDLVVEARAAYRQAADLGSVKASASLARLEGVVSLRPSEVAGDDLEGDSFADDLVE